MQTNIIDLEITKGTTFSFQVEWDDDSTGLPVSLSGYDAKLQVRPAIGDPNVLVELTVGNGGLSFDLVNGIITAYFSADSTKDITYSAGTYDMLLTRTDGTNARPVRGSVLFLDGVTQ